MDSKAVSSKPKEPGIFSLLKPYKGLIFLLLFFALISNGVNLLLPKIIANGIDAYTDGTFDPQAILIKFTVAILFVFLFTSLQSIIQTYASEKVARDLRTQLADQISKQSNSYIEKVSPAKLLTNLTADVDSIKSFISQAIISITSSILIIIGATILLLTINWKLALAIIAIIPIIGIAFFWVIKKVSALFKESRAVIDWLNKVINESILGAALIRVVNSQQLEYIKFLSANTKAKDLGLSILSLFAGLIPVIIFVANLAGLTILLLGGHYVINDTMTLGDFAAFNSYLALLIFPIIVIGFMSNVIAQATASYGRIAQILNKTNESNSGSLIDSLKGEVEMKKINVIYGQKPVLKNISFHLQPGSKTAIIGPTAAGKTQLLYLLTGLIKPDSGDIMFDQHHISHYNQEAFHNQVGFVFQDSIIFNMSIRENIAFNDMVTDQSLEKAIETAELKDFIQTLPEHLNTVVSERGSNLSGGQKQRIMLARALALNPKILLLDDFTARVDSHTEQRILANVQRNYPGLTLLSVTQKIAAVQNYDNVILMMQGEIISQGTHQQLMKSSTEYVQIYNSQQSTSNYELQS